MNDDRFLAEGEVQSDGPIAVMRTFVLHSKTKVLSGLAELSHVAGREGRDEWAWAVEAEDALIDAFFAKGGTWCGPRYQRFSDVRAMLARAFRGGRAQREIDLALTGEPATGVERYTARQIGNGAVCDDAMSVASAHATIYVSEIEFAGDRHPENIRREIGYVATKVAQRHAVTAAEAAYCALKAFEDRGLKTSLESAAWALERACVGHAEREAHEERARERAAEIEAATAGLFGVHE